jgi:ferredoxin
MAGPGGHRLRVVIDLDKCIASGNCVLACPEVFAQDELEGTVIVLQEHPPAELHEKVHAAVRACPAAVISTEPA